MATAWVELMSPRSLWARLFAGLAFALCCLVGRPAQAWVETDILGHQATVIADKNGQAEVRHQLLIKLRGGPLESIDVEGVGQTPEALTDAIVRRTQGGTESTWPLGVEPREDGSLHLRIDAEKGLRGGIYQFEFAYRISLTERNWFERRGQRVRLTWVGPRFSGGVDSAKVIFRLPKGRTPPALPGDEGEGSGVLLSQVRNGADFDEVELVRAHIARGEPAIWRVELDGDPFDAAFEQAKAQGLANAAVPPPPRKLEVPKTPLWVWSLSVALGIVFSLVCLRKGKAQAQNAARWGAEPRALLPISTVPRSLVAGLCYGGAIGLGLAELPTLSGLCLAASLFAAILLPPVRLPKARGPGEWARLTDEEGAGRDAPKLAGRFLDASTVPGFVVFATVVLASAAAAWVLLPRVPYQSALLLLASSAVLPVFFTGKAGDAPPDAAFGALPLYRWVEKKLSRRSDVHAEVWARRPLGGSEPDELRLRVVLDGAKSGLLAIEVGLEIGAGLVALPCVIVRAMDESEAYQALPRGVVWVRGRNGEERVAILRPRVPTRSQCLEIVEDVLALQSARASGGGSPAQRERKSKAMSSGKGAVTANAGTPSPSPAT